MGSHQRSWLWGKNCILETLRAGRWRILELAVADTLHSALQGEVLEHARAVEMPFRLVETSELDRICGTREHQGLAARMEEFSYSPFEIWLQEVAPRRAVAVLDGIQDPFNFGAMIRAAAGLGIGGILIAAHGQVGVTSLVARTSVGTVNRLPVARVESLEDAVDALAERGFGITVAAADGEMPCDEADWPDRTAIIIGNEGQGVSEALRRRASMRVRIPLAEEVESLNAAVSAGVLFYEIMRSERRRRPQA